MTTESVNEQVEEQVEEQAPPALNAEEQRASADGWQPLDAWVAAGNDASTHRSAREFNDRGELLRQIQDQKRHIQRVNQGIERLQIHQDRVYQKAFQDAVEQLKAQHRAAVEAGDLQKADQASDQIADLRAQQAHVNAQAQAPRSIPELDAWRAKNTWYDSDDAMRAYADVVGAKFVAARGGVAQPDEVLTHVEKEVKARFMKPEPKVAAPDPVAGRKAPASKPAPSHGLRKADLSDDELKAMKDYVSWKLGTEDQYLAELAKVR